MSHFIPPLSTHTTVPLPRTESCPVVITFVATPISADPNPEPDAPLPQLWTNLPTPSDAEPEWRAIPFLPLDTDTKSDEGSTPPSEWPILELNGGELGTPPSPPSATAAPQPRFAILRMTADASFPGREYGYTYRIQHPDGGIEWLGSDGSNGSFKFELERDAGETNDGGENDLAAAKGRWVDGQGQDAKPDAESATKTVVKRWAGGEGEVPGVKVGEGWGGIGISWDGDLPTAHLVSSISPSTAPLSTIVLHPTTSNPPIHHVGLPPTPILLTADANSFFLASGSTINVRHTVSGSTPSASLRAGRKLSAPAESGVEVLPSTGETTALLAVKSKTVFLYSAGDLSKPVGVELPNAQGRVAVYSEKAKYLVDLDAGKTGVTLRGLTEQFTTLKVIDLYPVDGSDILVGSVDPPTRSFNKSPAIAKELPATAASKAAKPIEEDVPAVHQEEEEADEEPIARPNPDAENQPESSVVAVVLRFFANFWQAVLALFGIQSDSKSIEAKEEIYSDGPVETEANGTAGEPSERTPLLPPSSSTHSHLSSSTGTTLTPSSPALSTTATLKKASTLPPTLYAPETLFDSGAGLVLHSRAVEIKVRRNEGEAWKEAEICEEVELSWGWIRVGLGEVEVWTGEERKGEGWEVWVGEKKAAA